MASWEDVKKEALQELKKRNLPEEYHDRLDDELYEIEKQGVIMRWVDYYVNKKRWDDNKNGLVLPWLLGMTPVDPLSESIEHKWVYQTDFPDIDIDFLPHARDYIKRYAYDKYKNVCSVGSWVTYKPKSALQDVSRAMGEDFREVIKFSKLIPDEFDALTLEDLERYKVQAEDKSLPSEVRAEAHKELSRYKPFYEYWERDDTTRKIVDYAFRLVGKIKTQGTHAGGLIIADRPIENIVPLSYMGRGDNKSWTSQWTEGRSTQLSKLGFVKFDILGLKTMGYVWLAGEHIKNNRNIVIDWSDPDPTIDKAGVEVHLDGSERRISLKDEKALAMCNALKTESVFQVETDIQKGIISDGSVKDFNDLVIYNALGRPGPIDTIPEYIRRRDEDPDGWQVGQDKRIVKILEDTYGIICYQEQLQALWQSLAGFTVPEAEFARKVIAKKWEDKLPDVEKRWKEGAISEIGEEATNNYWLSMQSFGRYAFNKSHSVAYSLITYMCLYLKANYPAEWWAAAMTACHQEKLPLYMSAAKKDEVKFGVLDVCRLTDYFTVHGDEVTIGIQSIKGIGASVAEPFTKAYGTSFTSLEEVIEKCGKKKTVFERLIKLGAFDKLYANKKALWYYYVWKYSKDKNTKELREEIASWFKLSDDKLQEIRDKKIAEYKEWYPKRKKLPKKVEFFTPKIDPSYEDISARVEDFDLREQLDIEKEYLGYYWHSPLDLYRTTGYTIQKCIDNAKQESDEIIQKLEVVIEKVEPRKSKKGNPYYALRVTDGVQTADIVCWADIFSANKGLMKVDNGIYIDGIIYNVPRKSFRFSNNTDIIRLMRADIEDEEEPLSPDDLQRVRDEDYPLW